RYTAKHSALVHQGSEFDSGASYSPRRWIDAAEQETDFEFLMLDAYAEQPSIDYAFSQMVHGFFENCQEMILDERWTWPRPTVRQNEEIVASPRDIFDIGELYRSGSAEVFSND
ncbi:MAG: hypothetical protein AAFU78_14590, partial [Cyanobacteria bacterium J06633_2]